MKIVNLAYQYFPDNEPVRWIEGFRLFYGIWEELSKEHEITYLHFTDHIGAIHHNGLHHRFLSRNRLQLLLPFALHRLIRSLAPDAVVIHGLMTPLQVWLLRRQLGRGVRIVVQHHAEPPVRHPLKKLAQRCADAATNAYFFTGRDHAAPWLSTGLIRDRQKVHELMEASSVFHAENRDAARRERGITAAHCYLWVGHLNANKNPLLAAGAFLRFIEESGADAAMYLIFQSNALLDELKALLAAHPDAARRIHLVGKLPHGELQGWCSAADFILSSSHYEGSGVAVCEGMSCGCIPILTDIPSFRYMTGGRCGLLYETGDADALLAALHQSIVLDKGAARDATLQQCESALSFKAIAGRIQELLSGLMP